MTDLITLTVSPIERSTLYEVLEDTVCYDRQMVLELVPIANAVAMAETDGDKLHIDLERSAALYLEGMLPTLFAHTSVARGRVLLAIEDQLSKLLVTEDTSK